MSKRDDLHARSELLWDGGARGSRGPKPTFDRGDVIRAAIKIADRKGLAAVTMQAVAAKLGFTTMALYRYFPNKQALIDGITDAAYGPSPPQPASISGWREAVRHWAYAKRTMLCARPWLAELPFVAAPHGPNWLSWHEAFLATIVELRLSPEDMMDMLSVVDGYVRGNSDTAISLARARSQGISFEQWATAVGRDLARAINDPRYPIFSAILTSQSGGLSPDSPLPKREGKPRGLDESFHFGLDRVLDGIQVYVRAKCGV